ncbi:MAG TPA: presenilin family intramembrane aspartyl protease PSH [Candidatus Nanoarchaeia archaeon]|nr:presenilin family intramembrane aspartyl protease PSH [Candidatus Nanoarchaeia archaeon]
MDAKTKAIDVFPIFLMGALFVVVDLIAFWVTGPFQAAGEVAYVGSPSSPVNLLFFFVVLIVFTAIILLIAKLGKTRVIQAIFLGSTGLLGIYVFYPLLSYLPGVTSDISLVASIAIMALIVALLVKYPEWYIVDASGIITAIGAVAMLGISLTILIVLLLLIGMALYDAISVYKTKHMIDLADTLVDLKLPILFVIPKSREYSLVKETKGLKEKLKEGGKRDAFFMGVGDIVIPGILAAAAYYNIQPTLAQPHLGLLIGLSVIIGTLVGFAFLMVFVLKGKPQAGLPFLCPGAILGYVIASLILTHGLAALSFAF